MRHVDLHLAELSRTIDPAELGRRLRTARVAAGMTQAQVAADDITAAYLSRIEDGQRRPEVGLLERMAKRVGVSLEDLLLDVPRDQRMELQLAIDHAELALVSGDAETALAAVEAVLANPAAEKVPDLRRAARQVQAGALERSGDLDAAIIVLENLVADPSPDARWLKALIALARCYRDSGEYARAIGVGDRAGAIIEELGLEGLTEAIQLTVTVAAAHLFSGDTGTAMRTCMRAVEAADKHSSIIGKASAYWNASVVEATRGQTASAIELARKALAMFELSEDHQSLAKLRSQIANLHLMQDPPDAAMALEMLEKVELEMNWSGVPAWDVAFMQILRAKAQFLLGNFDATRASLEKAAEHEPADAPLLEAQVAVLQGRLAFAGGDHDEARRRFQEGVLTLTAAGVDRGAAQLWFELAELLTQVGDTEGAMQAFRSAGASTGLRLPSTTNASSAT